MLLLSAAPCTRAADAVPAASPFSASVEVGVAQEVSRFNEVRIGDSPAILIRGDAVRRSELFRHAAAIANATVPCAGAITCTANLNVDVRDGARSNDVDTAVGQADAGVQYPFGETVLGARVGHQHWNVGHGVFRRIDEVTIDAVRGFGEQLAGYASVNVARYRHPGDAAELDANYLAGTVNLRWAPGVRWDSAFTAQATVSREANRAHEPALDVRGILVRAAWDAKPAEGWETTAAVIGQVLLFGAFDEVLGVRRTDRFVELDLTATHRLTAHLDVRLQLGYARYRSTAAAFDNDWKEIGIGLQWKL